MIRAAVIALALAGCAAKKPPPSVAVLPPPAAAVVVAPAETQIITKIRTVRVTIITPIPCAPALPPLPPDAFTRLVAAEGDSFGIFAGARALASARRELLAFISRLRRVASACADD